MAFDGDVMVLKNLMAFDGDGMVQFEMRNYSVKIGGSTDSVAVMMLLIYHRTSD